MADDDDTNASHVTAISRLKRCHLLKMCVFFSTTIHWKLLMSTRILPPAPPSHRRVIMRPCWAYPSDNFHPTNTRDNEWQTRCICVSSFRCLFFLFTVSYSTNIFLHRRTTQRRRIRPKRWARTQKRAQTMFYTVVWAALIRIYRKRDCIQYPDAAFMTRVMRINNFILI